VTDPDPVDPTPVPAPGAKRRALEQEQKHVARIHDRVEELRQRADDRLAAAVADRSGSTFQARFERDVTAHHHATRSARYTFGDVESLAFGRLDHDDGEHIHVGRVSVVDEDGEVILVDWRAPAAAAFYQATAAQPHGVARRRTLTTRGREVTDLDDEVIDHEAAERLGLEVVTGQGALLAALARSRSTTMRDIVATIQADQDRIVRSPATGTLVVTGGPGTGKTVVALHRVAYLLYQDRERFEGRGVLVVGPSRAFAEYTSRVLPALGEDRAVQRPLEALGPAGLAVDGWDRSMVGAIKGDLAMVEMCRRLLARAVPPLPPSTRVSFEGTTAHVAGEELDRVRARLLERVRPDRDGASYHERSAAAADALNAALWRAWSKVHRSAGHRPPDERVGTGFDEALDEAAEVTMLRRCFWPKMDAESVLARLAEGEIDVDELAGDLLDEAQRSALRSAWDDADGWRVDDVALLDEVASLLGELPAPRTKAQDEDPGLRVTGDPTVDLPLPVDIEADGYRDFAHVVVDEAQDLTPMQWRSVARRGPYASWTVVGDLAQRSRVAEPSTWEAISELIGRRQVAIERLTVNYRTPTEIVELAREVLAAAGHDPDSAPTSVRSGGAPPQLVVSQDPARTVVELLAETVADLDGTIAVISPKAHLDVVREAVDALPDDLDLHGVRVLDPRTVKGLEFDEVLIVAPDRIVAEDDVGTHQLYVAVTRATRRLRFVAERDATFPGIDQCDVVHAAVAERP
jgi:hypothetical protein